MAGFYNFTAKLVNDMNWILQFMIKVNREALFNRPSRS